MEIESGGMVSLTHTANWPMDFWVVEMGLREAAFLHVSVTPPTHRHPVLGPQLFCCVFSVDNFLLSVACSTGPPHPGS